MRVLPVLTCLLAPIHASAQVLIRRVVTPPPTTFAALTGLQGFGPSPACRWEIPALNASQLRPIALPDSTSVRVSDGWQRLEPVTGEDPGATRLVAPDSSRVRILRERNGSTGKSYPMYRNNTIPTGETCSIEQGQAGIVWTFYEPDPDNSLPRPYFAYGEVMTPAGKWYRLMVSGVSRAQIEGTAATVSGFLLRVS